MARVCRPLQPEAERILYAHSSLPFYHQVLRFHRAAVTFPHPASLIRGYEVVARSPDMWCILDTVSTLSSLEILDFWCGFKFTDLDAPEISPCQAILALRFPCLRRFRTNFSMRRLPEMFPFVWGHPGLEQLEIQARDAAQMPIPDLALMESLRTLSCFPRFLRSQSSVPALQRITRLHLFHYTKAGLLALAHHMGQRLVSLRLDCTIPALLPGPALWTPRDVAETFPRLRLLHLDFAVENASHVLPNIPMDWHASVSTPQPTRGSLPPAPLTVVWSYCQAFWTIDDPRGLDGWHKYMKIAAFTVLKGWTPYVSRIAHSYFLPECYMSTRLKEGRSDVVQKPGDVSSDYWLLAYDVANDYLHHLFPVRSTSS